jgi:SAM-dependent methyltransferase
MSRLTRNVRRLAGRFNRARYDRVMATLGVVPADRVVELGCGRGGRSIARFNVTNQIVGIDVVSPDLVTVHQPNFTYVRGDASHLGWIRDDEFDVVVSFGMLEHLQPRERMVEAIREAQRIAHRYCFVVPHRYAFVEPHFLLPFFPIWPDRLKSFLIRRFSLGSQRRNASGKWQHIHWLPKDQWRDLFDDPNLRIVDHWYGPVLLDYLIFGGPGLEPARGRPAR